MMTQKDLENYVMDFCNLLRIDLQIESWRVVEIHSKEKNQFLIKNHNRPDFEIIILKLYYNQKIPFFQKYIDILEKDNSFIKLKKKADENNAVSNWFNSAELLLNFIKNYLQEVNSFSLNKDVIDNMTFNFLDSLTSGVVKFSHFTILRGACRIYREKEIDTNIIVRNLTIDELSKIIEVHSVTHEEDNIPKNVCIIEAKHEIDLFENYNYNADIQLFKKVVSSFRIIHDGNVDCQTLYTKGICIGSIKFGSSIMKDYISSLHKRYASANEYNINEIDWSDFDEVYNFLKKGSIPKNLKLSIDRLDFASNRTQITDKLLDLIIALEAIYGDSNGAISYKIGLRASMFLYDKYDDRDNCFEIINSAYSARNSLVHGGKKESFGDINKLFELIRLSILRVITHIIKTSENIKGKDFDKRILNMKVDSSRIDPALQSVLSNR